LEGHVLLKKLRDALESLKGCFTGRNKEDVEKAISMVCYFILYHAHEDIGSLIHATPYLTIY
jgi:hypothetical protein